MSSWYLFLEEFMIYRIDMKHFLTHMIDHFSLSDINNMQYCIISAKIANGGKLTNVVKMNDLYPDSETVTTYYETKDKDLMRKMYLHMLKSEEGDISPYTVSIYQTFVNPLLKRFNIMIICDEMENDFIDVLCEYMKDEFHIEVIDLNTLFTEGHIGPIYIDRDEIRDRAVDIRRAAAKEQIKVLASTKDGKEHLISLMNKKKKLKELKRHGIDPEGIDDKDLDAILLEEWCREDGQWND